MRPPIHELVGVIVSVFHLIVQEYPLLYIVIPCLVKFDLSKKLYFSLHP